VEREDEAGHWQLPQGGIDVGESAWQSIKREMAEELGTDKFKIIKYIPQFHKYKWPKVNQLQRGYRGQIQDLFILRFTGQDSDIKLDQRENVNFKWVDVDKAVDEAHDVRGEQMEKAVMILRQNQ
jgi:putative (di)nucleoside polyphosphate hydrolase